MLPQAPVRVDAQVALAERDEARNLEDGVGSKMVKLEAVVKEEPTKEFVGRERERPRQRNARNITLKPAGGRCTSSLLGTMASSRSSRNPIALTALMSRSVTRLESQPPLAATPFFLAPTVEARVLPAIAAVWSSSGENLGSGAREVAMAKGRCEGERSRGGAVYPAVII